jgi:phosphoribosyl 1,2-cyclic phosphodiesterase
MLHSLPEARFCVLASSSSGNCSAIVLARGTQRRLILVDAGLSPRRTRRTLADLACADVPLAGIVLTHLDRDHWNMGWVKGVPEGVPVFVHKQHRRRARECGVFEHRVVVFEDEVAFDLEVVARASLHNHDDLGAVSLRFEFEELGRSLAYITDCGRASEAVVDHARGVDVLAIESNYCPELEMSSPRPWHLKRRVMGGHGHLSNEQCAEAVRAIQPREHVVLLHLSRECNRPELARSYHGNSDYRLTVARHDGPTEWIDLKPRGVPIIRSRVAKPTQAQGMLW